MMFGKCEAIELPTEGISATQLPKIYGTKMWLSECYNEVDIPNIFRGFLRVWQAIWGVQLLFGEQPTFTSKPDSLKNLKKQSAEIKSG